MLKHRVLIVEDDLLFASTITHYLHIHHFTVIHTSSIEEAVETFSFDEPCIILLSLQLPCHNSEEFCRFVRREFGHHISIIMMTNHYSLTDKIEGLKMGADHYLVKPFTNEELLAHMEAVLRRTGILCQKVMSHGLCLKPRKGEVLLHNEPISLTKHEFMILYYFMEHPNVIITREELIVHLYPNDERDVMDRTIDAHIKKLRAKIEANPKKPERILTVRGLGYKYVEE